MIGKYLVTVTFTEPMLASSPADPKVYEQFIDSRRRIDAEERGDEVATLPAEKIEQQGTSVYHHDDKGVFIFDYKVRGFLKEAATAVTGKTKLVGFKTKIDKWVFVFPRRLYLENGNGVITVPDGSTQRPMKGMTAQGPRITVKKSEHVDVGTRFSCEVHVLPLGMREINEEILREWFDYGKYTGFGEWRTGSYGRFTYELVKI